MTLHEMSGVLDLDTPLGRGRVLFFDAGGNDSDALWYVVLATGAVVCVRNREVRLTPNWTLGIRRDEAAASLARALDGTNAQEARRAVTP